MSEKIKEVSSKNTKQELLDVIEQYKGELLKKKSETFDAREEAKTIKQKEIVMAAATTIKKDLPSMFENLQASIAKSVGDIINQINSSKDDYNNIEEAIKIKKQELKDIYDLDVELSSLAAAIEAHKGIKESYAVEIDEQRALLQSVRDEIMEARKAWIDEDRKYKADKKIERDREEADYKYSLERSHKIENDKWEDEKSVRETALKVKETAAVTKEEELVNREKTMDDLTAKVASIPSLISAAEEAAETRTKEKERQSYEIAKKYIIKDCENEKKVLQAQIDNLNNITLSQNNEIRDLKEKLNAAYAEIKDMAVKTVDGSKANEALNTINRMNNSNK